MSSSGLNVMPLVRAVRDGRSDVDVVAHEVGASAAQLGVPLHEVMDHVERAYAPREPAFGATRAVAVAWAETTAADQADRTCEDPLTSLATVPHLHSRLAEVYREADRSGRPAAETVTLVVVELAPSGGGGHELERALRALDVAQVLRTVFTGDETVARLSPRRFAVLARRDRTDPTTTVLLARLLDRALAQEPVRLWVEHLPTTPAGVSPLLAALSRRA